MIDLTKLEPIGRKQWVKRKWDEYWDAKNTKAIERSLLMYKDPTNIKVEDRIEKGRWKATVDKKVAYLLSRPPVATSDTYEGAQDILDSLSDFLNDSARDLLLRGSLIWIVQGDGKSLEPQLQIMSNTMAVYADSNKEEVAAFIRKRVDVELEPNTGAETEIEYYECYYTKDDVFYRDTFCYSLDDRDKFETFQEAPTFIELGKTGDAPLYAYIENVLMALEHTFKHQDKNTEKNTKPLVEVRGYSGTSDEDLSYAIEELSLARTDGNGGVTIHQRAMDSTSIDLWVKRLMQDYYEVTCTVGKDVELQYAQSGKAMDRLFVDMDNDAHKLAHILELGLKDYFAVLGITDVDIVWNTDRPTDDASIISAIVQSRGLVSDRTLLEQHPWVNDVDKEVERLEEQSISGMEDLVDTEI